jgi:hypothetical protein
MLGLTSRVGALILQIDSLIERYGTENPQLLRDLLAHKQALLEVQRQGNVAKAASIMFRIATWVRFVIDHLPGP